MADTSYAKSITLPEDNIFRNIQNAKRFAIDIGKTSDNTMFSQDQPFYTQSSFGQVQIRERSCTVQSLHLIATFRRHSSQPWKMTAFHP